MWSDRTGPDPAESHHMTSHDNGHDMNEILARKRRIVVAQAVGILMARHDLDQHRAFGLLAYRARLADETLHIAATHLVDDQNTR
jgi:AmiR/NasT family two-component response regulator